METDLYFPDGNATVARLLVRAMIPDALPGTTLDDSITSRLAYDRIDRAGADARIRLNSTVVSARHLGDPDSAREVEITYVRGGKAEKVRADHCVMACYNGVIPHLVPEMSDEQKAALQVWRQDGQRLHERPDPQLEGLHEPGHLGRARAGDVPHRGQPGPIRGIR